MMAPFQAYAPFYDSSGQMRFAVLMGQYLGDLLEHHPVAGRRALDLACGTGTLALILADRGWDVVGLDRSEPMLAIARAKAEAADTAGRIAFVLGDMRNLLPAAHRSPTDAMGTPPVEPKRHAKAEPAPPAGEPAPAGPDAPPAPLANEQWLESFDLVTCTYDSLNYLLTADDLARCFQGVARVLRPGGLFFADMNTRRFLELDWGECEVLERPGYIQIAQSRFDPATACSTMVLTGFVGSDEHGYDRFDETHIERAYEPEVVAELLTAAGLGVEAAYDCFTRQPAHERSQRIAWLARKPVTS